MYPTYQLHECSLYLKILMQVVSTVGVREHTAKLWFVLEMLVHGGAEVIAAQVLLGEGKQQK